MAALDDVPRPQRRSRRPGLISVGALTRYLEAQGLPGIEITRGTDAPPRHRTASGKFRQVIAVR